MNRFGSIARKSHALVLLALLWGAGSARAGVISNFDAPFTPPPYDGWTVDRYAPAGFASGQTAPDGRTGTLQESLSSADQNGSRPSAYNSTFYNTQGRKYDLPGGLISAQIQLYVPSSWSSLNQSQSVNVSQNTPYGGRLASFWATSNTGAFPILEFNNNVNGAGAGGFRVWDDDLGVWINAGGFTGGDQWYTVGFDLAGGDINYFVNGALVASVADSTGSSSLGNVILEGYNSGNSYNIFWDNLSASADPLPTPEPATLALFGLGGLVVVACRFRRKVQPV